VGREAFYALTAHERICNAPVCRAKRERALGEFITKDSGVRESFDSGMVRDTAEGKADYSLVYDGPMLTRWAELLTRGAKKYAPRNWMLATGQA
jgi:hypothetical protein